MKASVLNSRYIETFDEYSKTISNFVEIIEIENADEMASLVTENFQLFDKYKVV